MTTALLPRPDLRALLALVENACTTANTKRAYRHALEGFLAWSPATLNRATVNAYRAHLQKQGKRASVVNMALSAVKKLAREAAAAGFMDHAAAESIGAIKQQRRAGVRTGNWLDADRARLLVTMPDVSTLKGKRDKALLCILLSGALRRSEACDLEVRHLQIRDGRPVLLDITGKGGKTRTVPLPKWAAAAVEDWLQAADITDGYMFRSMQEGSARLSHDAVWRIVGKYTARMGCRIAPHDLRRTFAQLALKGGADLEQISLTLGHSNIGVTGRYLSKELDLEDSACDHLGVE